MATAKIFIGTAVKATCNFENDAGALTDPTTITARTHAGDGNGTEAVYLFGTDAELVKVDDGIFALTWAPKVDGKWVGGSWKVRFEGTGAVEAAVEITFYITDTGFKVIGQT